MPCFAGLRRLFAPLTVILASLATVIPAAAQGWPDRPFTMVVPYAPGGSTDLIARLVAPKLSQALGQPVLVENMAGIGGIAGVSRVARAAPDGYQFVVGNVGTHAQNQFLFKYPPYDAAAEFAPVALLVDQTMVLTTRPDLPVDGLEKFIAHLRLNQQTMKYASAGFGSPTHLACALLNAALGVDTRHVPYRGGSLASRDLMTGKVDYFCSNLAAIKPHIEAGRLKAPAMLSRARARSLKDIPTAQEQGLKDFEATNWLGLFLPVAVAEPIVERLNAAVVRALADRGLQDQLRALDAEPVAAERNTNERVLGFLAEERAKWGAVIRSANIRLE
jgi:tripartite-type tricarboxylate transporter receptor subunit TctC